MKQETFTDMEYSSRKKKTKREELLEIMEDIIPWEEWVGIIAPYYPQGKRGCPPMGIEKMLRMYLLQMATAKAKLSPDFIRTHGKCFHGDSIGYIIGCGTRFNVADKTGSALTGQLHQAQSVIILKAAGQGSCVIVGCCTDYVLAGKTPMLDVFIHSELPSKVQHSVEEHGINRDRAASILTRQNKARAYHYRFYTDQRWRWRAA